MNTLFLARNNVCGSVTNHFLNSKIIIICSIKTRKVQREREIEVERERGSDERCVGGEGGEAVVMHYD